MSIHHLEWPLSCSVVVGVLLLATASGCGSSDDDGSITEAVAAAATCAELSDTYEAGAVSDEDAVMIADRLVEIAEADYAEDGTLDELLECNSVIRDLDSAHASAFQGIDLEEIDLHDGNARNG
jgi:hypothetical protein